MGEDGGRRKIPPMNDLLAQDAVREACGRWPREQVVDVVRLVVAEVRDLARGGAAVPESLAAWDTLLCEVLPARLAHRNLRRVVNATGIVLHTNLGRAALPRAAEDALRDSAFHFSNLEYDLDSGERGSRHAHVESLLCEITGAEAGIVVNNNAAAVLLALDTLAAGKEAIVSRGQLVEIGGSFRVPDVMAKSGARLVEVGTTNKTRLRDYELAITSETALLLKVHTSNFKIVGFTEEVALDQLVRLGGSRGVPVMEDLGSGVLIDLSRYGLPPEPTVQSSVAAGADLVTFSGDKLLGATQAGLIVGRKALVDRIRKNPLARALRVDKLTLSALEATLRLYRYPEAAVREVPTLAMLTRPLEAVKEDARRLAQGVSEILGARAQVVVVPDAAEAGGGSLPGAEIPSYAVGIRPVVGQGLGSLDDLMRRLRAHETPVIAHVRQDWLLLNLRTVRADEFEIILAAVRGW